MYRSALGRTLLISEFLSYLLPRPSSFLLGRIPFLLYRVRQFLVGQYLSRRFPVSDKFYQGEKVTALGGFDTGLPEFQEEFDLMRCIQSLTNSLDLLLAG
jgi:hypothetical protein